MAGSGEAVQEATPREVLDRFVAAYHARDWLALRDLLAPGFRAVDRRPVGWGSLEGPDAYMTYVEGGVALAPDARVTVAPIVLGGCAGAFRWLGRGHLAEGGREYELEYATLSLVEAGRITYVEYGADEDDALARFEEIGARTEPERIYGRFCRALNGRDWDGLGDCLAEDYDSVDHRIIGWEPVRGREAVLDFFRSWDETARNMEARFEWLDGDDAHAILRSGGYGRAADEFGGGAFELVNLTVVTVGAGRVSHAEHFDVADEAAAFARLAELQRPAQRPTR